MLDLEKAYDKVDRRKLLHTLTEWLDDQTLDMFRATLGTLKVMTKNDPCGFSAQLTQLTRGVPQGAPSSLIYMNSYIHETSSEVHRRATYSGEGWRMVTLVTDDVLLQAISSRMLQELLDTASW